MCNIFRRTVQVVGEMSIGELSSRRNDQTVGEVSRRRSVHHSPWRPGPSGKKALSCNAFFGRTAPDVWVVRTGHPDERPAQIPRRPIGIFLSFCAALHCLHSRWINKTKMDNDVEVGNFLTSCSPNKMATSCSYVFLAAADTALGKSNKTLMANATWNEVQILQILWKSRPAGAYIFHILTKYQ